MFSKVSSIFKKKIRTSFAFAINEVISEFVKK